MTPAVHAMLARYDCRTEPDYVNALKEILQEIALMGLWRAKFFEHAAFYGGTSLRILYGLDRFSEDLDFSLLKPRRNFALAPYLTAVRTELAAAGFEVSVDAKEKRVETAIESAFIKAGTKEHLLKIQTPRELASRVQHNAVLKIKLEVDTDPPGGFLTETKTLLLPIPFSVNSYRLPDLFAGKVHAILERKYSGRIKGRDYYDFIWYLARNTPVHLEHLTQRLRQSGAWSAKAGWRAGRPLTLDTLTHLLVKKFADVDFVAAKRDVRPFIKDPAALDLWSKDFFRALLPRLKPSSARELRD
jgi:predicted nucleotidyltransferase component of viral defense system